MITVRTSPSLALIKYWGKSDIKDNLPATSSLAVSLDALYTETRVSFAKNEDVVSVDDVIMPKDRYAPFFTKLRAAFNIKTHFFVESESNFPAAAGLASSSSGFAALAFAASKLIDKNAANTQISDLARLGSASAARAVYGGFTILEKNALHAKPLFDQTYWPELRILISIVKGSAKKITSRNAMELSRITSPYYPAWLKESDKIFDAAKIACLEKNLNTLGPLAQKSYLMMFSTMFTSSPPLFYWEPESLRLIKECESLREEKYSIWETMDAGPQVKMLCLEREANALLKNFRQKFPNVDFLLSKVGEGPRIIEQ